MVSTHVVLGFAILLLSPRLASAWSLFGSASAWSLFGSKAPPRMTQSLLKHLNGTGASRVHQDMAIIPLSKNECGIQFHGDCSNSKDKELVYIDRTEFVSPACGRDTAIGRAVETYFLLHETDRKIHGNVLPSIYIAIFLCLTKTRMISGGTLEPYLRTLPSLEDLQHLPVFWSDAMLEELQSSVVKLAVSSRRDDWRQEYDIVCRAIIENAGDGESDLCFVDFCTWCWARSILSSRAFTDSQSSELCLVPYVDMMNHASPSRAALQRDKVVKCEWIIDADGFQLNLPSLGENVNDETSTSRDRFGKQMEISYGDHSNSNFLMNYGFSVLDDAYQTPEDKAILSLYLSKGQSENAELSSLWEADGLGDSQRVGRNVTVSIGSPGPMQSLLSLCRVVSTEPHELCDMQDRFVQQGATTEQTKDGLVPQLAATLCCLPFSIANEIRAMEMLQVVTRNRLDSYATTLLQDERLLLKKQLRVFSFGRRGGQKRQRVAHRNALIVRRGEKRVLQHYLNIATICLEFLKTPFIDFETYKGMLEATLQDDRPCLL